MSEEKITGLANGAKGVFAEDPGARPRHIWAVEFPELPEEWKGSKLVSPYTPKSFRYGSSPSRDQAIADINTAAREGRPNRDTAKGQFVVPEGKPSVSKPTRGRGYKAARE